MMFTACYAGSGLRRDQYDPRQEAGNPPDHRREDGLQTPLCRIGLQ